jgi:hypothetical protein
MKPVLLFTFCFLLSGLVFGQPLNPPGFAAPPENLRPGGNGKSRMTLSREWSQRRAREQQLQADALAGEAARMKHLAALSAAEREKKTKRAEFLKRKAHLQSPKAK